MDLHLTNDEKKAIASLKRLEKKWPKTLWLFAGGQHGLSIMKVHQDGQRAMCDSGGVDPDYSVGNVSIPADGGDW